jgi:hypothetical protein
VLWLVVISQGALLVLALGAIALLAAALFAQEHRVTVDEATVRQAECDNHYSIATAPLSGLTTKTGVTIIESNRKAFVVLGCPGQLGAPSAELVRLGEKYQVPIRY